MASQNQVRRCLRYHKLPMMTRNLLLFGLLSAAAAAQSNPPRVLVLHAARVLDVEAGTMIAPGEVLVEGDRIREVGAAVRHPAGAEVTDLGNRTLLPGLIDAHVHLFLHARFRNSSD